MEIVESVFIRRLDVEGMLIQRVFFFCCCCFFFFFFFFFCFLNVLCASRGTTEIKI